METKEKPESRVIDANDFGNVIAKIWMCRRKNDVAIWATFEAMYVRGGEEMSSRGFRLEELRHLMHAVYWAIGAIRRAQRERQKRRRRPLWWRLFVGR